MTPKMQNGGIAPRRPFRPGRVELRSSRRCRSGSPEHWTLLLKMAPFATPAAPTPTAPVRKLMPFCVWSIQRYSPNTEKPGATV